MKNPNQMCTVVVSSNDAYSDTWYPFFTVLKNRWKDNPFPIILNTESKDFSMPGLDIRTFRIYQRHNQVPWSKRLKETLRRIETPYIIFLLEDFFIEKDVDTNRIFQCIQWMEEDAKISVFDFAKTTHGKKASPYPGFAQRKRFSQYKFNAQAALWRREDLIKYLRSDEDPWVWEFVGNFRSFRTSKRFYCCADEATPVFEYRLPGIVRGKWNRTLVEPIVKQYGIELDYSLREAATKEEAMDHTVDRKKNDSLYSLRVLKSYIVGIAQHFSSLF